MGTEPKLNAKLITWLVRTLLLASVFCFVAVFALAQGIVPVRGGLIRRAEGRVLLNERTIRGTVGVLMFQEARENDHLRTEDGRAEVLLAPDAVLFVNEKTHVELLSTLLADVQVRVISGSVMVEDDRVYGRDSISIIVHNATITLGRSGLYRLDLGDGAWPRLQVWAGHVVIRAPGVSLRLKSKKEVEVAGNFTSRGLPAGDRELLKRWKKRRAASRPVQEQGEPSGLPWWTLPGISRP